VCCGTFSLGSGRSSASFARVEFGRGGELFEELAFLLGQAFRNVDGKHRIQVPCGAVATG
jgi:hypothetical protein